MQPGLRCHEVNRRQTLLGGVVAGGSRAPDAADGGAKEAEGKGTTEPGHDLVVWLITLAGNHRSQSLVAHSRCIAKTTGERQHKRGERAMLNLSNPLFISALLDVLVLPVASGDGLPVGRGVGVENPHVEKSTVVSTPPKPTGRYVQTCSILRYCRGSRQGLTGEWL